ncbi:MAG: hypothetical protein E6611_13165 [Intestinibacter bartlettii]|uniref:hypothetical protein n=1 Tax=Intestinibacter bartlettii TaxID=261299 RepID=UPI00290C0ACD|nr:hypothetical protein [Intestinibacter bartlettii]MDU6199677.1 hypothetical protein [Intestinibacter bartlettii]
MREKLINLLESFGYPVHLQGSLLSVDDYPDSFFTFWNFQNDGDLFYDNESHASDFGYWIYFYSSDPELIEDKINEVKSVLKKNKFIVQGPIDARSDIKSHTGKMLTIFYKEV